jgi:imidazolonepropionase-like amidohydrolase
MRLADQGRVKEGNSADFVVCDGDPLADIKRAARKENHRLVVKRGIVAKDNRAAFVRQATRVAAE